MKFSPGDLVVLHGRTGAGKSTIAVSWLLEKALPEPIRTNLALVPRFFPDGVEIFEDLAPVLRDLPVGGSVVFDEAGTFLDGGHLEDPAIKKFLDQKRKLELVTVFILPDFSNLPARLRRVVDWRVEVVDLSREFVFGIFPAGWGPVLRFYAGPNSVKPDLVLPYRRHPRARDAFMSHAGIGVIGGSGRSEIAATRARRARAFGSLLFLGFVLSMFVSWAWGNLTDPSPRSSVSPPASPDPSGSDVSASPPPPPGFFRVGYVSGHPVDRSPSGSYFWRDGVYASLSAIPLR